MDSTELAAPAAYLALAQLQISCGKTGEAIWAFQQALQQDPDWVEAHVELARLFRQQKSQQQAIAHYQKALTIQPQWWQGYRALAQTLQEAGDLGGAAGAYKKAIALAPSQAPLYCELGVVQEQQGKLEQACHSYHQAITLAPKNAVAYNYLGCALAKSYQLAEAIKRLQTAINLDPKKANYHNNLGQVFIRQEKTKDAIASYQQAIDLKPDYTLAYYNLGKALQYEGLHPEAAACFEKVVQLEPDHRTAYSNWGTSLIASGEVEKGLTCWQNAVAPYTEKLQAYQEWVETCFHSPKNEWESAKLACSQFLKTLQASKFQEAQEFLCKIYSQLGDATARYGIPQQAEQHYQIALRLQPRNTDLQKRLGDSLAQQGRAQSAIAVYRLALTLKPHDSSINRQLGKLLEKQGQWDAAITCYREVLSQQQLKKSPPLLEVKSNPQQNIALSNPEPITPPEQTYFSTELWLAEQGLLDDDHYVALGGEKKSDPSDHNERISCRGLDCAPCLKQINHWFLPIQMGQGFHRCSFPKTPPVSSPSLFVARIPYGRAWAVPQENHWLVCKALAVMTPDDDLLSDLSRDYPGQLPPCSGEHTPHQIFKQEQLPPIEKINGTVAVLTGLSGNVYFHWMIDILPRFALLSQGGINPKELDYIWINQATQAFQRETLEILGIPLEKVIASDDHPHIEAEQLIAPSFAGHLGWLHSWGLKFLRETLFPPLLNQQSSYPERIYICRQGARHRRVLNEDVVIDYLSTRGFVPVALEELSFSEQVNYFASAKAIIAPHGSGLTNLVFCSAKTKIIELFAPNYIRHYFWVISQQLQLEHYFLVGSAIACPQIQQLMYNNSLSEDIWVELATLKQALDRAKLD
ncbi:Tetratricopeptide TPR_1 repeat-containing protein [Halothece sp. PCC 7418]|uniref:tetratricopeptide repeat protein n=1 Tax=Halothece sp. (strain PCC 7418) TaxID=65093 RepID=UPI0002A05FCB|nr:tetratricopeptide repeat protein [Halothece sp. PCC 7418]AFZ45416.1 Tetratricopeptide TPR_1 repeat-containing protein [Halothece sp. PCC 7418]